LAAAAGATVSADISMANNTAMAIRLENMGAASCSVEASRRFRQRFDVRP
jgi:hypothetical protein